ncbi:MAG: HAD family hydrolase [Deltaproteobacteria bacterium]|nr:HAD family hydrolase [Deltaproteobacteria bacterium]
MAIKLVVLDFDGTFTDAEAEAAGFIEAFKADVFDLLGRDATLAWQREEDVLRANPSEYGWSNDGVIAAPANADPYLRVTVLAQNLCDIFGILRNEATRTEVLEALYRKCYGLTESVPRPDAKDVLEALLDRGLPIYVVTNSRTDTVQAKIDGLSPRGGESLTVIGNARKFVMDTAPRDEIYDGLEDLAVPGLTRRKVALKRGHYYDALRRCWQDTGTTAAETLVCGDIFELDLALPLTLGAHVHLMVHDETPPYEVTFVDSHERGGSSRELSGILARL